MNFLLSLVSALTGWFARAPLGGFSPLVLRVFAICTQINLKECESELCEYPSLDSFFTRGLKHGIRNFEEGVVSPCDGAIRCLGTTELNGSITVKGTTFTPLGITQTSNFEAQNFAVLYLSPKDYHRVHVPFDGTLVSIHHIPGNLYPVNGLGHILSPKLYETNERVVFKFLSDTIGEYFLVMVGALNVGRISYIDESKLWHPILERYTSTPSRSMRKGEELGVFHLGSSVVLLFSKKVSPVKFDGTVRLGEKLFNL